MGTNCISSLLSSICNLSYDILQQEKKYKITRPFFRSSDIFCIVQFFSKPIFELLEDEGSKASGEGHSQKVVVFLSLIVQKILDLHVISIFIGSTLWGLYGIVQ